MADDFNKVSYDKVFDKKTEGNPFEKVSQVGSRMGGVFFGLMFGGFALIMLGFVLWSAYGNIIKHVNYRTAQGVIIQKTGSPEDSSVEMKWEFGVNGKKYTGERTFHEGSDGKFFTKYVKCKTGTRVDIHYNPADPTKNELHEKYSPGILFMALFIVPFIASGYMIAAGKIRGGKNNDGVSMSEFAGGMDISLMLFLLCCPAAFIFTFIESKNFIPWQVLLAIFLFYAIVIVPTVTKLIHRKLKSKKSAAKQDDPAPYRNEISFEDEKTENTEIYVAQKASFMKEVGPQLLFTTFWWLILGVFLGVMGYQICRYIYAEEVFVSTEGRVLSSEVKSHSGENSTTYSPEIKYVYHVNGQKYIGKNYELTGGSSSGGWAGSVVSEHPRGKKVTVYYNPSNPSDAALSIGIASMTKVFILFLQPFIAAGIFMIYWSISSTIGYFISRRPEPDFNQLQLSSRNLWGRPEIGSDSLRISFKKIPNVFLNFIFGYGGATFAMIFIAAIKYDFNLTLEQIFLCLKVAAGIGGLAVVISVFRYAFGKPEILNIDKVTNSVSFESKKENWQLSLSDIQSLRLEEVISAIQQNNKPLKNYRLQFVDNANKTYTMHTLKNSMLSERQLISKSMRAGRTLADFIGRKMDEKIAKSDNSKENLAKLQRFAKFLDKMN